MQQAARSSISVYITSPSAMLMQLKPEDKTRRTRKPAEFVESLVQLQAASSKYRLQAGSKDQRVGG